MRKILLCSLLLVTGGATAHEAPDDHGHRVVPDSERETARQLKAHGPQENRGIEAVTLLGEQSISGEEWVGDRRRMRVREIVIQPGGVVAVHQHQGRPGMAYILEGSILEHRSDSDGPIERTRGAVSFEKTGITHWWENTGDDIVRALVVDLIPGDQGER